VKKIKLTGEQREEGSRQLAEVDGEILVLGQNMGKQRTALIAQCYYNKHPNRYESTHQYTVLRNRIHTNIRKYEQGFIISGVRLIVKKDDLPSPGIQKRIQRYELATVNNRAE